MNQTALGWRCVGVVCRPGFLLLVELIEQMFEELGTVLFVTGMKAGWSCCLVYGARRELRTIGVQKKRHETLHVLEQRSACLGQQEIAGEPFESKEISYSRYIYIYIMDCDFYCLVIISACSTLFM